jgi:peptidoglycan hydrolase-like protein with peptidoglycan-binding domain
MGRSAYRLLDSSDRKQRKGFAMTKSGLIVPLCFVLTSGCALFDSTEMTTDQPSQAAPVVESTDPSITMVETPAVETPITTRRNLTRDDIRKIQLRLREVGFDPGPIDGVAGARTKTAFVRFQAGCSNMNPVIENWTDIGSPSATPVISKIPNREETQAIQTQLRNAGFNAGPVDGIFGNKTRSLLVHLKNSCPMANDFAALAEHRLAITNASEKDRSRPIALSPRAGNEAAMLPTASQPALAQEDIKILQLQLRDAGFDPGLFDGIMGPKTRLALQQFQANQRINKTKTALISGKSDQY